MWPALGPIGKHAEDEVNAAAIVTLELPVASTMLFRPRNLFARPLSPPFTSGMDI